MAAILPADEIVAVGRVGRPVGLDGGLSVELYSGDAARLKPGMVVLVGGHEQTVERSRPAGPGRAVIHLASIASREESEAFRGAEIEVPADSLPELPPGAHYHFQILGSTVRTVGGETLGEVSEIIETGSNDVYVVKPPNTSGPEVLIPAIEGVVVSVDIEERVVTIDPPDGLL